MRKKFTILCSSFMLLGLLGGGMTARAAVGDDVTSTYASKTFTIGTNRGYWYVNALGISGCKGDLTTSVSVDYPNVTTASAFCLVPVTQSDKTVRYYLYSLDYGQWIVTNGDNNYGHLSLSDKPYQDDYVTIVESSGSDTYNRCIKIGTVSNNNMFGISPDFTPDVIRYYGLADEGNRCKLTEVTENPLSTSEITALVQSITTNGYSSSETVSSLPIASADDFNGQEGKSYLIYNISSSRNGYLHVDANGAIRWAAMSSHANTANFVFKTVSYNGGLILQAANGQYIPQQSTYGTKYNVTTDEQASAGVATIAAKSGYAASTFNLLIDGKYMNVNPNGVVLSYNDVNDANGVWELIPVSVSDDDFTAENSTVNKVIVYQNGDNVSSTTVATGRFRIGQTVFVAEETNKFLSSGTNTVSGSTTNVKVYEKLPFELSTDDTWHWYYMDIRDKAENNRSRLWVNVNSSSTSAISLTSAFTDNDYSWWAFKEGVTNGVYGIRLYNKALGENYSLKGTSTAPTMGTGDDNNNFIIRKNEDGFVLKTSLGNNNCMNDVNGSLGYWNDGRAPSDDGSTFRVFPAKGFYTMLNYQKATGADNNYGYLGVSSTASTNNMLFGNDAEVSLNNVVYIEPTAYSTNAVTPRYVSMKVQGNYIQGVSQSTQVSIGTNTVSFLIKRPNVGYYAFGSAVSSATPANTSYLHDASSQSYWIVGWSTDAVATSWKLTPAGTFSMPANEVDGKYYATFYAPYAVELSGAKAYTLTLNDAKNYATLTEVKLTDNILPANSPVLIIANGTTYTVKPVISTATEVSSILKGVSLATDWSSHSDDLVLGKYDGKVGFYKWSGSTLKNNRCYLPASLLTTSGSAKGVTIDFGTVTAINAATLQPAKTDGKIYNLQGQEVTRSYKGVVIKNGRKVLQ